MTSPPPQQPQSIRVLNVTTGYPRFEGDVFGSFIADTAEVLAQTQSITVLAPHSPQAPTFEKKRELKIIRFPYWPFGQSSVAYGQGIPTNLKTLACKLQLPFFMLSMMWNTWRESQSMDLIHAHWGISALLAWPAALLRKKPLLISFHGSDLHGSLPIQKVSRWMAARSQANICVSREQAKNLGHPADVISYALDSSRFSPLSSEEKVKKRQQLGLPPEEKILLMVGYLIPLKRVHLAIEALSLLDEGHLAVVGEGEERQKLQALCRELHIETRVHFLGKLPYDRVHEAFQCADIHLLCSEREGKPNVIYQAMACEIPSISTPVGGVPEQVLDHQSGYLVEGGAPAFADKIRDLFENPQRLDTFGQSAKAHLESLKINPKGISDQILSVYHRLIQST